MRFSVHIYGRVVWWVDWNQLWHFWPQLQGRVREDKRGVPSPAVIEARSRCKHARRRRGRPVHLCKPVAPRKIGAHDHNSAPGGHRSAGAGLWTTFSTRTTTETTPAATSSSSAPSPGCRCGSVAPLHVRALNCTHTHARTHAHAKVHLNRTVAREGMCVCVRVSTLASPRAQAGALPPTPKLLSRSSHTIQIADCRAPSGRRAHPGD
jgi:hypothetical protein